jgi:hypothetical protein
MDQNINTPVEHDTITDDQLQQMKTVIIESSKKFALAGTKTVKNSSSEPNNPQYSYDWWENEQSFDGNFWSVSYWAYPENRWQIQVTKLTIAETGHSVMTSYSVRMNDDKSFPGFQIYEESLDNSYRPLKIEEYVLLDRVLRNLVSLAPITSQPNS